MSAPALLAVHGLHCRLGKAEVLRGIDLSLATGEVVGLVGPNGSGKSTLLKCLGGLRAMQAGSMALDGRALADYSRAGLAHRVAYVPQHSGPAMSLRVIDMVTLGRLPHRGAGTEAQHRAIVLDVIERLGLQTLAMRHVSELSGGERQRVLMARALAQQPRLLLLDEPTSDLDLRHQLSVMATVRAVADAQHVGAVIAIHDLALAARFCDRLVMLKAGAVHAQGPSAEVLTPANIAALFGVEARVGNDHGLPYVIAVQAVSALHRPTPKAEETPRQCG